MTLEHFKGYIILGLSQFFSSVTIFSRGVMFVLFRRFTLFFLPFSYVVLGELELL